MNIHRHQNEHKRAAGEKINVLHEKPLYTSCFWVHKCQNFRLRRISQNKKSVRFFKYLASKSENEISAAERAVTGLTPL